MRPGYEGNVIFSKEGLYELDAHYDRVLIKIDYSKVSGMTWGVQTPFDKATYTGNFSDTETPEAAGIDDYKWIKFAINEDYGQTDNQYVKYPGDQNYKGGKNESSGYSGHTNKEARLLDVHQLLQRLREEYNAGEKTGTVTVTAFIDEYVYVREPDDTDISDDNNPLLAQWRRYVEAEDRLLYFIDGEGSRYSPDGASSVVTAVQTFKQKSIRTVYNVNKSETELPTAWGVESRLEGGVRLKANPVEKGNSTSNGRLNTILCILGDNYESNKNVKWTDIINTSAQYGLQDGYQDALYAILLRNRDLNGDNIVQPNEIRWYLAAVDQLVDLYLGEYALDDASRLYPQNAADRDRQFYWHYTSSSRNSNDGNAWVLWAEECAALGSYTQSYNTVGGVYAFRCIRNLGIGLDAPEKEPEPLIPKLTEADKGEDGTYVIDCSNLSVKARRLSYEASSLPVHDDQSAYNRPYTKFRVAAEDCPAPSINITNRQGNYNWGDAHDWTYYQTATITPNGYRAPNMREMLIMYTRLPKDVWPTYTGRRTFDAGWPWETTVERSSKATYLSFTDFSRKASISGKTGGFRYEAANETFGAAQSNTGYVRGVKDEQ